MLTAEQRIRFMRAARMSGAQIAGTGEVFCLEEETVGLQCREGAEHHIVGQEMGVGHLHDRVDAQGVTPQGILPDIGLP